MKLSVIIVNYNVAYYLEQALYAVFKSMQNINGEVIVVDNHSVDSSLDMLSAKFPQVRVIANMENVGFAKANNQAIQLAKGEYILLLNPDTLVEEDTFEKCLAFMDKTPNAGSLGVKMVNGKGEFLPESKRGIPFPSVAFYKIFGLSKLFPSSKKFGGYHLTYLRNDEIQAVEVLSGAFMLIRRSVLNEIGLLDEDYFMYGEDIDLSYRIIKAGYKNYYFPETRIIHYKGVSTKKSSLGYVHAFYKAMRIFAYKHFAKKNARFKNWIIDLAIWIRASLAVIKRVFSVLLLPILDFIGIYVGIFCFARYWEGISIAHPRGPFPPLYLFLIIPIYVLVWLLSVATCHGYRKPVMLNNVNKGIAVGTVIILLIYALLPVTCRFSRATIVFGAMWTVIFVNLLRYLFSRLPVGYGLSDRRKKHRAIIVGNIDEGTRVFDMVRMMEVKCDFLGIITLQPALRNTPAVIGDLHQLRDIMAIYRINEVIFCSKDLPVSKIIDWMERLQTYQVNYKIAFANSLSIIGSNAFFTLEDICTAPSRIIMSKENCRRKRAFDIGMAVAFLLLLGFDIWFVENKIGFLQNLGQVLAGKKSWVGCHKVTFKNDSMRSMRQGVLFPTDAFKGKSFSDDLTAKADLLYVRDYQVHLDVQILYKGFRNLGRI